MVSLEWVWLTWGWRNELIVGGYGQLRGDECGQLGIAEC